MPIVSPQLDDLRYDAVVQQLLRRIPVYTPEWTDWNDSDPGVTLIQLFAYLAEQVGYRLNQVPEKNYVEFLKLLGVRLQPAFAAATRIGIFLSDPTTIEGFTLDAPSRFTNKGSNPAIFESDVDVDIVPAEPSVLVTTSNPFLWDLLRLDDAGGREPAPTDAQLPKQVPTADCRWLTVAWDGKKPAPIDMPLAPVTLLPISATNVAHPYLWVGIKCNDGLSAGFAGVTVTMAVQLDDDEKPDPRADILCQPITAAGETQPPPIDWLAYWDPSQAAMAQVPGRIDDSTIKLTRSGTIRFTVPSSIGAIPSASFANLRDAVVPAPVDACTGIVQNLRDSLVPGPAIDPTQFQTLLTNALTKAQMAKAQAKSAVGHPLDPSLRDDTKFRCWLRLGPLDTSQPSPKLRYIGFNVVPVTNLVTVTGELLGIADGRPGQTYQLAHGNILADSLEIGVQEDPDTTAVLVTWTRVASLDGAGPNDRVFELDPEAGTLTFGDGNRGRIPPLVAGAGAVVALRYRWGGGVAGEMDAGTITVSSGAQIVGLAGVTNFVAARGGRDAETLDQAKLRARKELSTRSRAVTAGDFEWIALQTPSVRVRRAIVVPRRRPLPVSATDWQRALCTPPAQTVGGAISSSGVVCAPPGMVKTTYAPAMAISGMMPMLSPAASMGSDCGPPLPEAPAGLDDDFEAAGVVSVVVVPDAPQPPPAAPPPLVELVPTPSFLRAVCTQLDLYRLVTTEVHVVSPQYLRLCRVYCRVKPRVGYTRLQLRDLVIATLSGFLDVLQGGEDGQGAPFGGQVHIADLIGRVLRTEGVERVDELTAHFVRTKSNAPFREGNLVMCPRAADDYDHVDLAAEETTSIDVSSFTLDTV